MNAQDVLAEILASRRGVTGKVNDNDRATAAAILADRRLDIRDHPGIHGRVSWSVKRPYPYVDLVMPNGRKVVGLVVPGDEETGELFEMKTVHTWVNPLLPPESEATR